MINDRYTKTPNYIFDKVSSELNPLTNYILLHIIRLTVGYHKLEIKITHRQLLEKTNTSLTTIGKALKELTSKGFISIDKSNKNHIIKLNPNKIDLNTDQNNKIVLNIEQNEDIVSNMEQDCSIYGTKFVSNMEQNVLNMEQDCSIYGTNTGDKIMENNNLENPKENIKKTSKETSLNKILKEKRLINDNDHIDYDLLVNEARKKYYSTMDTIPDHINNYNIELY